MKRGEEEAERVQSKSLIQAEVKDTKVRSQYAHLCKSGKSNDDEFKGKEAAKRHKIQRKDVTLIFQCKGFSLVAFNCHRLRRKTTLYSSS